MRLATYRGSNGAARSAVVIGAAGAERLLDLAEASGGRVPAGDLLALFEAGPAAMAAAREVEAKGGAGVALSSVKLLAPIQRPGKLLAVAGNFQAHIEEGGGARVDKTKIVPKLFIKPSSSIIGPGESVALPTVSNALDWELELAIVIGTRGRDIPLAKARDHIAGYSVINDISARSMQWGVAGREPGGFDDFFDWLNGKWGDGFAAWGPWITTTDAVKPDPNAARDDAQGQRQGLAARLDLGHDLQPRGDHRLRLALHDPGARRRDRRRHPRWHRRRCERLPQGR